MRHPQHRFDAPTPLVCWAASFGLWGLKQRAQLLPQGIGQLRQSRQTDRFRQGVHTRDRRSLTGAALCVTELRSGLMAASEARPPHQVRALLLSCIDPPQKATHFCKAQLETGRAFFSRTWWRTTESTACAKRANVMKRYQAR